MRRIITIVAAGLLVLAVAGPAAARPYVVRVDGQAGWTFTGISVEGSMVLPTEARGFVQTAWVTAFLTQPATPGSGPAGQTWGQTCGEAILGDWYDPAVYGPCGVEDAYFGELIARVGDTTWAVGDASEIVVPEGVSGPLLLAANDLLYTYADNRGHFTVTFR